jgi:predicted Fe-Mo cluster-binding NifX family protein
MKIAVTSAGTDIDSEVDPRFGRASWFLVVDPDTMAITPVENHQNLDLPQGAGIQAGKTIVDNGVNVLITGNCGPKAYRVLENAGVQVVVGASGKVRDVIQRFQNGELKSTDGPNVKGHWV